MPDAAEDLGLSERQVRRLCEGGQLVARQLYGVVWVIWAPSVLELVEQRGRLASFARARARIPQ